MSDSRFGLTDRRLWGDVIAVASLALAFRLPALAADFWFDEILSYERFARRAQSINDIFFNSAFKHDNNHHLNTVTLYLLGEQSHWVVYRLAALILGLIAVSAAVLIGRRHSRIAGLISGGLVAVSYMMAIYSTEARGYAALLAFVACGFLALDRFLTTRSLAAAAPFWFSIALGLMAHPAILQFYLGALLWTGFRLRTKVRSFAALHAVPAFWIAAWILFITRGSIVGGGPPWTGREIVDMSLAWTIGYPVQTVPPLAALVVAAAIVVWDAWQLWRDGSDEGLFHVAAILGPVVLMTAAAPPYLFPRYFLVPLFFFLLVTGRRIASLAQVSAGGRALASLILVLVVAGNFVHLTTLLRERRGTHAAALQLMTASSKTEVTVSSWSLDQWTAMPLEFYARRLGLSGRLRYVPRADTADPESSIGRIDWMTDVAQPCTPPPALRRRQSSGAEYVLARSFAICGPSGMSWYVYTRSER